MIRNTITVKVAEGFTIFNNDKERTVSAVIESNKKYKAKLYELTEEYFAKDSMGREFLVGETNMDLELVIEKDFELVE